MKNKYIIIGSSATEDPKTHGGTTVLVSQLLEYFEEKNKDFIFIEAKKYEGKLAFLLNYLYVIGKLFQNISKADIIMVNVASRGAYFLSPLVLLITKVFNKKFVFRMFGGNFIELYKKSKGLKRKLISYVIKNADIMFFEPKYLVKYYKDIRSGVHWFPNIRRKPTVFRDAKRVYKRKMVYLGQIRESKGLDELIRSAKILGDTYSFDLYGTLFDEKYSESLFAEYPNIFYRGRVHKEKVYETLSKYDILLLPSYMEGYPGVLIEAFGVGLPVVSTKLPSIKEMVDGSNGILVEPKNVQQLVEAIKSFNVDNYPDFSKEALNKFNNYEYESVYRNMISICEKE